MNSNNCNDSIFCTKTFKKELEKLRKNNSYKDVDSLLLKALKDKKIEEFLGRGTNLNRNLTHPYVKLDVGGRSGYRLYYIAIIINNKIYLGFIHPKTGSKGSSNTTDDARTLIQKEITGAIKSKELYKVKLDSNKLKFEQQAEEISEIQ